MKIIKGNIFTSKCQTLVNTVNCVGIMGAGIAFEMRLRFPDMYIKYKNLCDLKLFDIGKLWLYKDEGSPWILNFPTKRDWKLPSKIEFIEKGLKKFLNTYKKLKIESIAFPLLGANHGKLTEESVLDLMSKYLSQCDIPIEIYIFDKYSSDELYNRFSNLFRNENIESLIKKTRISKKYLEKISHSLQSDEYRSISSLLNIEGIGEKTIEKIFFYLIDNKRIIASEDLSYKSQQLELF